MIHPFAGPLRNAVAACGGSTSPRSADRMAGGKTVSAIFQTTSKGQAVASANRECRTGAPSYPSVISISGTLTAPGPRLPPILNTQSSIPNPPLPPATDERFFGTDGPLIRTAESLIRANAALIRTDGPLIRAAESSIRTAESLIRTDGPLIRTHGALIHAHAGLIRAAKWSIRAAESLIRAEKSPAPTP